MKSKLAISNFISPLQYFTHTAILFWRNPHAFCTFSFYSKYPAILYRIKFGIIRYNTI